MIVAVAVLAVVALAELGVLLHLVTRRTDGTERERLLARDNDRLQRALEETTDKLLHVVGRDFNVAPVDVDPVDDGEPEDDPFLHFRHHDDLDDVPLLLEPEPASYSL